MAGFTGDSAVTNPPAVQFDETQVQSLGREDVEEEMATHARILAWEIL